MSAVASGPPSIILQADDHYPPLLREIADPPEQLSLRGDAAALLQPQLAIVGSRRASSAGLRLAAQLAGELAAAGLCICSGLALGIDGAAHRGALAAGGRSVAVMATGIDRVYPRRHTALAQALQAAGGVITEFPPGAAPRRENFPRRNRIISGMALGVLVVEAAPGSGSLITARAALEQGREVFALPWSILHQGGRGCLQLLRDGAKLVESVGDILEELGPLYAAQTGCAAPSAAAPDADLGALPAPLRGLLQWVGYEVASLDQLARDSGRPVAELLGELSALEIAGHVQRVPGGYIRS